MSVLLEASQISKVYGDRRILNFDNFKIYSGDRIGVVGLNGSGKTNAFGCFIRPCAAGWRNRQPALQDYLYSAV